MRNKCGVFAVDTYVKRGTFMIQECFNQDAPPRVLRWREKIAAAVRLSPSPPQWPDAVPARDARMNL
jgi:hypothetical protein